MFIHVVYFSFFKCIYSATVVPADHEKELSQHIQRHMKLSRAASSEKRGDREAGADGGKVVVGVHCAAVGEV